MAKDGEESHSLGVLIPSQGHPSEPKCWKKPPSESISRQSYLLGWGGSISSISHCQHEVRGQSWFFFPPEVDFWHNNKPWTWSMKGYRLFQDIEIWYFPHVRQWPRLCKDLEIKKILQDWGCDGSFILKCRKNIYWRCPASQWSQDWGNTQEWGVSSHSWLPLCSASGSASAPLFTAQEGGQSWLYSPSLPREEGNAPMHYI